MTNELEYVVKDALMICDKGAAPGFFMPTHNMHIKVSGCLVTNRMDMLPVVNIPTFGICACTGCPCMPAPTMWQKTYKVKVKGQETLLARSYMPCALGGKIQFLTSGQIPLPPDALEDIKELQENGAQKEEEGWGWLDTLELVPVVGSIVGAVREGTKGNWGMMAINIGFLAMDIAGIISFGSTTAAATAGKAALKTGVKVATQTGIKQVGRTGLKTGLKLMEKGARKIFATYIDDITKIAGKGKKAVTARAVYAISKFKLLKFASKYGIKPYSELRKLVKGKGLEVLHLIEKRFANVFEPPFNKKKMLSIVLTKDEHRFFTNLWRSKIPYGTRASERQVKEAAKEIYKDYPEILKALGL